jgi:hypothetical protein
MTGDGYYSSFIFKKCTCITLGNLKIQNYCGVDIPISEIIGRNGNYKISNVDVKTPDIILCGNVLKVGVV